MTAASAPLLDGLTVVDLTSLYGNYAGRMLVSLGATVILVEPPGGDPLRRGTVDDGRWFGDVPGSAAFAYLNGGKRSVELDLANAAGRDALIELCASADLLLEGFGPGGLEHRGLATEALLDANPRLVVCRLSPYGQTGPDRDERAVDITLLARAGLLHLSGSEGGPPQRPFGDQSAFIGGAFAASAAMVGVVAADRIGGQVVDVSMHEGITMALENAAQFYDLEGVVRGRGGGTQRFPGVGVFPAKDGWFYLMAGGFASEQFWPRLLGWLGEEHVDGLDRISGPAWLSGKHDDLAAARRTFTEVFTEFSGRHDRATLYAEGQARGIPCAPVNDLADLMASPQLQYRNYLTSVSTDDGRQGAVPSAPWLLGRSTKPAATLAVEPLEPVAAEPPWAAHVWAQPAAADAALAGIRVIDFSWIGAGSYTTKILADHGAEVIKLESSARPDQLRMTAPFKDGIPGLDRSGYFADRNSSKLSVTVDLKHPRAREIVSGLLQQADLVVSNFSPGTMTRLGWAYETVRKINPSIIFVEMSTGGSDGPQSRYLGYGMSISALAGLHALTGPEAGRPTGMGTNYPDHVASPTHAVVALLAAVWNKRRTGEGEHIDLSQTEAMINFLGPAVLAQELGIHTATAQGNAHPRMSPHGVYSCAGEDSWIAIVVEDAAEWGSLAEELGLDPDVVTRFADRSVRMSAHAEVDGVVSERTAGRDARELEDALRRRGLAASAVRTPRDLLEDDPQLAAREHWVWAEHAEIGSSVYSRLPWTMSASPPRIRSAAPLMGEHTVSVLTRLLGLDAPAVEALIAEGVLV